MTSHVQVDPIPQCYPFRCKFLCPVDPLRLMWKPPWQCHCYYWWWRELRISVKKTTSQTYLNWIVGYSQLPPNLNCWLFSSLRPENIWDPSPFSENTWQICVQSSRVNNGFTCKTSVKNRIVAWESFQQLGGWMAMCGHWSIWMISKKPLPDWNKDVILVTLFVFSSVSKGWILGVSKVQGSKNSLPRKWELWLKNQIILTFSSLKFNFGVCASMHITQVMTPKSFWLYSQDFRISYSKWQRSWKKIFTHCDPTPLLGQKGASSFPPTP